MAEEEKAEEEKAEEEKAERIRIDVAAIFDNSDCEIRANITHTKYSNLAYINATERDVHINFMEIPGNRVENEVLINTTRIYMSHSAAQKFASVLQNVLKDVHSQGVMEAYTPEEED